MTAPMASTSFAEFAVLMLTLATREAIYAEQVAHLAATAATPQPLYDRVVPETAKNAELAGQLHAVLKSLMPYEREIRELVARLEAERLLAADEAHRRIEGVQKVITAARSGTAQDLFRVRSA